MGQGSSVRVPLSLEIQRITELLRHTFRRDFADGGGFALPGLAVTGDWTGGPFT